MISRLKDMVSRMRQILVLGICLFLIVPSGPTARSAPTSAQKICRGNEATIVGTGGPDRIVGTRGKDVIAGLGGDDTITSIKGSDLICGGEGNDVIEGGPRANEIYGGPGNDTINGGGWTETRAKDYLFESLAGDEGNDTVVGGDGEDFISGDEGTDRLYGHGDADRISGDEGPDLVDGGAGDDALYGSSDADTVIGGDGEDELYGDQDDFEPSNVATDSLDGGPGDDRLDSTGPNETLDAGDGDDDVTLRDADSSTAMGGAGEDTLIAARGPVTVDLGSGTAAFPSGTATATQFENVFGTTLNDTLIGSEENNRLHARQGDDTVEGHGGDDYVKAGVQTGCSDVSRVNPPDDGADIVDGGSGNDTILGGNIGCFGSDGNDELRGGEGNDSIWGSHGDDSLSGDAGNDFLNGETGTDLVDGGDGTDRCVEGDAIGCELITAETPCTDGFDNDYDEKVDFPSDPGCSSYDDDYEGIPFPDRNVDRAQELIVMYDKETRTISGYLKHAEDRCEPDRTIELRRVESEEVVSSTTTEAQGSYSLNLGPQIAGRFEVAALEGFFVTPGGEQVICSEMKSPIRVKPTERRPGKQLDPEIRPVTRNLELTHTLRCGGFMLLKDNREYARGEQCLRFFALRENDPERDYGVLWLQASVRGVNNACLWKVRLDIALKRQPHRIDFAPKGRRVIRERKEMETRLTRRIQGTRILISQNWRGYEGGLRGYVRPGSWTSTLLWKRLRRRATQRRLAFASGALVRMPQDTPPAELWRETSPVVKLEYVRRRAC